DGADEDDDVDEDADDDSDEGIGAVAVVPGPGRGVPIEQVPYNVQRLDRAQLGEERALGLHDALNARLGSVVLNDVQNNPLQPDLQYRGFTTSPLLGSPQGIAVYQNGVRIHDAFGDVVQWDLLPEFALYEVQLLPGANSLYGLNALGGGLALRMNDGYRAPGTRIEALAGSFERYQASAEHGHVWKDWAFYGGVSAFGEQGFRDESPSSARHLYADARQRTPEHEIGINVTLADTDLNGNGPAPIELLERDRRAVFTLPDITNNRLLMVAADGRRVLTDRVSLQATAYFRHLQRDTLNGDEAELESCEDGGLEILCDDQDAPLLTEGGSSIAAVDPQYDAVFNTTSATGDGFGGSLQATFEQALFALPNRLDVGASYDGSAVAFQQRVELGHLTEERAVAGDDIFIANDGFRTKLDVDNHHLGVFASDTYTPVDPLSIQLAARFNLSDVELSDRLGSALDGHHTFQRVNPALGVTVRPGAALTLFASYGESSRAPSAIELSCADPEEPCRVPNAFLADPPLEQVVTRAAELGVRGAHGGTRSRPQLSWSLAGFGSRNFDDIVFVAGSRIGTGFFQNAGQTQRIGLEANINAELGLLRLYASYTLLRATFESQLMLPGLEELGEEAEIVEVEKGNRLPGLPAHSAKAGVTVTPLAQWSLGLSVIAQSSRPFRGDEANQRAEVDGYAVLNAQTSYQLFDSLQLFIKVQNLLDTDYETFGLLGNPSEVLEGTSDPRFLGPGAPLGVWGGIELRNL
ncbi:MAG TPA: TonB-dependent receptor, partial [Polyangiales bacterium]|nr:TonB-dependent receptor [Polyangiales bacterium]